jgi:WD40 repeat protein
VLIGLLSALILACQSEQPIFKNNEIIEVGESLLAAEFSGDGSRLLMLTSENQVKLWDLDKNALELTLPQENLPIPIRSLTLSNDAQVALVIGENDVVIYRLTPMEYIGTMRFEGVSPLARISSSALSHNKIRFVAGMEDGTINMAQLDTGINNSFRPHRQRVSHLLFESNGEYLYSGSLDGQIAKWRFAEPKALYSTIFQHRITSLQVDEVQSRLFVSDGLREQNVYDSKELKPLLKLDYLSRFKPFRQATFESSGRFLVTAGTKRQLTFWDLESGQDIGMWDFQVNKESASLIALKEVSKHVLLTVNTDGMIEKWPLNQLNSQVNRH